MLRSELPDAIEKALKGDERYVLLSYFIILSGIQNNRVTSLYFNCLRCTLDTMRLVDLLLVLLFEGRKALSQRGGVPGVPGSQLPRLRRMDSVGEKTHRQLIDCIRSKDTDALVESIDSGGKFLCCSMSKCHLPI